MGEDCNPVCRQAALTRDRRLREKASILPCYKLGWLQYKVWFVRYFAQCTTDAMPVDLRHRPGLIRRSILINHMHYRYNLQHNPPVWKVGEIKHRTADPICSRDLKYFGILAGSIDFKRRVPVKLMGLHLQRFAFATNPPAPIRPSLGRSASSIYCGSPAVEVDWHQRPASGPSGRRRVRCHHHGSSRSHGYGDWPPSANACYLVRCPHCPFLPFCAKATSL